MSSEKIKKLKADIEALRIQLTQKDDSFDPIPDNWKDFAPLCTIRSGSGFIPFNPYEYQKQVINAIESHRFTVILKSRQLGITELVSNYALWNCIRNPSYYALFFSKTQKDTSAIATRVRRAIESLGAYCKPVTDSKLEIQILSKYGKGGTISFRNSSVNSSRGAESINLLFFDEGAFVDNLRELYGATIPCQSMVDNPKCVIASTPNTTFDFYFDQVTQNNGEKDVIKICDLIKRKEIDPYQQWTDENGRAKIIIHWLKHPKYGKEKDFLGRIAKDYNLPVEFIEREYNLSFTSSDVVVFSSALIQMAAKSKLKKLNDLDPDGVYFMGVDPSGYGNDYTVACVLKRDKEGNYSLVHLYRAKKSSTEQDVFEISNIIKKLNPIAVNVETNAMGQAYFEMIRDNNPNTDVTGSTTTLTSKEKAIGKLIAMMQKGSLTIPNKSWLTKEFLNFKKDAETNRLIGCTDGNDDIVMSLAIATKILLY